MLTLEKTGQFRRDIKLLLKQRKDLNLLYDAIDILLRGEKLPAKYADHSLKGNYIDFRECHITPD